MHSQQQKDYDSSPPQCAELDYLDIHSQSSDMRYAQDANTSTLAIEPTQPPALLNLFHSSNLNTTTQYPQDSAAFYQPASHVYPGLDVRSRIGSRPLTGVEHLNDLHSCTSTTSSTGMAHAHSHHQQHHRAAGLPHSAGQISARDQYSAATPTFRRAIEHPIRSPSFPSAPLRRHPLTPTPSPLTGFAAPVGRMEASQYQNRAAAATVPPLLSVQTTGTLQYPDGTPIKVEITGTVDKGFFLAEGEWTCYRRNYMACNCSYSLHPHWTGATIQYLPTGSEHPYQVHGFSMCISAVVADNDQHSIELVQHTPKRDKGPISKPEKIPLAPKNSAPSHHTGLYSDNPGVPGARQVYPDSFSSNGQTNGHPATEHTFERIQFKQATQNNGRRRAAQQYYHLMVELWADLGNQVSEKYVKVAYRKSEKMIVRGRSPGHYQNGKGRSHSSGPGGSAGTLGYNSMSDLSSFSSNSILATNGSYTTSSYEARGALYGNARHHHDIPAEATMSSEDEKAVSSTKGYQYYPGAMYEGQHPQHPRVDMFSHHRAEPEPAATHIGTTTAAAADTKIKTEYDLGMMPRVFHPPHMAESRRQNGPFDGKPSSSGYYPTMMTPPGANLTMP